MDNGHAGAERLDVPSLRGRGRAVEGGPLPPERRAEVTVFGPYPATVLSIHDGDTMTLSIDLGFDVSFRTVARLYGINSPELATPEGKAARAFAETLVKPGDAVTVRSHGYDKFGGRTDCTVGLADGRDFGSAMVAAGFARPYFGVGPKT